MCHLHVMHTIAGEDIKSGTVIVDGNYNGFIPYHENFELCDLVKDVDKTCPIKKGILVFKLKMNLPEDAPTVSFSFFSRVCKLSFYSYYAV